MFVENKDNPPLNKDQSPVTGAISWVHFLFLKIKQTFLHFQKMPDMLESEQGMAVSWTHKHGLYFVSVCTILISLHLVCVCVCVCDRQKLSIWKWARACETMRLVNTNAGARIWCRCWMSSWREKSCSCWTALRKSPQTPCSRRYESHRPTDWLSSPSAWDEACSSCMLTGLRSRITCSTTAWQFDATTIWLAEIDTTFGDREFAKHMTIVFW